MTTPGKMEILDNLLQVAIERIVEFLSSTDEDGTPLRANKIQQCIEQIRPILEVDMTELYNLYQNDTTLDKDELNPPSSFLVTESFSRKLWNVLEEAREDDQDGPDDQDD